MAKETKETKESKETAKRINKYQGVILAARRARELNQGIDVTPDMEGRKITSIAVEELEQGKLKMEDGEGESKV